MCDDQIGLNRTHDFLGTGTSVTELDDDDDLEIDDLHPYSVVLSVYRRD